MVEGGKEKPVRKHPFRAALAACLLITVIFVGLLWVLSSSGLHLVQPEGRLGLVEIKGVILESEQILADLRRFQEDPSIKGVMVRVDSPGGGVGASQEIFQELYRTTQFKPVICSMGAVAASGGYYVAAACTRIVANPATLTGSIGVISSFPNLQSLFEKIGFSNEIIASGPLKGAGQLDRPLNDQERAMFTALTQDFYNQFVADIARARKMDEAAVRAVADGRIFSGKEALQFGLVDELGNYTDALGLAYNLSGLSRDAEVVRHRERGSWMELFLDQQSLSYWRAFVNPHPGPQYLYQP